MHTGRTHIFRDEKITADVVMASAALPLLFRAVEIDGVPHWDGGYMGNPADVSVPADDRSRRHLIVQINPVQRKTTPRTSGEIVNRLNEITFNSALIAEMRSMEFVNRLIDDGQLSQRHRRQSLPPPQHPPHRSRRLRHAAQPRPAS